MTKEEYHLYHESEEELAMARDYERLPERCRECKYLGHYTMKCNFDENEEGTCFYDERHYCSDCANCHRYGVTDELYCDIKETLVDEIDCCEDFDIGDDLK